MLLDGEKKELINSHFVNLLFNLVIIPVLQLCNPKSFVIKVLVDIFSSSYFVWSTYSTAAIKSSQSSLIISEPSEFYTFFVISLCSWIAAFIFDFRTCYLSIKMTMKYFEGIKREISSVKVILLAVLVLNSIFQTCNSSVGVYETLSANTTDKWLYTYYIASTLVKILSAICQGTFLVVRKYRRLDMADEYYILRLAFVNTVTFCYSLHQVIYYGDTSSSLLLELGFKIITSGWCVYALYNQIKATAFSVYTLFKNTEQKLLVYIIWVNVQQDCFIDAQEEELPYPTQESDEADIVMIDYVLLLLKTDEDPSQSIFAQSEYKPFVYIYVSALDNQH